MQAEYWLVLTHAVGPHLPVHLFVHAGPLLPVCVLASDVYKACRQSWCQRLGRCEIRQPRLEGGLHVSKTTATGP